jgi:hypothetical protein
VSWNRRQTEHGARIVSLPTRRGYLPVGADGERESAARASYEQCCYVRAVYQLSLVRDLYGRKNDALELIHGLLQYIEKNVRASHLLSVMPTLQALRLAGEMAECASAREALAAQRAWVATVLLFPQDAREMTGEGEVKDELKVDGSDRELWQQVLAVHTALNAQVAPPAEGDGEGEADLAVFNRGADSTRDAHFASLQVAKTMHGKLSYPYTYPYPTDILLAMVHAMTQPPSSVSTVFKNGNSASSAATPHQDAETQEKTQHMAQRRMCAYHLVLMAKEYSASTSGSSNASRLHAPIRAAVKLCKLGTETGPMLSQVARPPSLCFFCSVLFICIEAGPMMNEVPPFFSFLDFCGFFWSMMNHVPRPSSL